MADKFRKPVEKKLTELKALAKDCLARAVAVAYYSLDSSSEYDELSEAEKNLVLNYIDQFGTAMCKAIGRRYYTL